LFSFILNNHFFLNQRMIQFEPLLAMATIGLNLDIPVLSMLSIKQFLDGQYVEDRIEYELLRKFVSSCWDKEMFMNKDSLNSDQGSFADNPIPYITSEGSWTDSSSVLREKMTVNQNTGDKKVVVDIISPLTKKLYEKNQRALKTSAFCKVQHTFTICLKSLFAGYDLRGFFGGMSKYHDSRALLESLNFPFAAKFSNDFMDSGGVDVDPVGLIGRVDHDVYCYGVRLWDMLLFFAIMKRPRYLLILVFLAFLVILTWYYIFFRRDVSLIEDVSATFTEHMISMLPMSIFPYNIVPANKVDSITNTQRMFDFGQDRTHGVMIRGKNLSIFAPTFKMECKGNERSGVLEDEMYMTSLIMMSVEVGCDVRSFPIDKWPVTVAVSWGVCYPFHRYPEATSWNQREGPLGDLARSLKHAHNLCVMMHPSRHSMMLFVMDEADEAAMYPIQDSWIPTVRMVAEFATAALSPKTIVMEGMDEIQHSVFSLGFGPMPFYRR
jgi:hypothetical protein